MYAVYNIKYTFKILVCTNAMAFFSLKLKQLMFAKLKICTDLLVWKISKDQIASTQLFVN